MKRKLSLFVLLGIVFVVLCYCLCRRESATFRTMAGETFGTTYHVTYQATAPLDSVVTAALRAIDGSLSMFNPQSTISQVNNNTIDSIGDTLFVCVVRKGLEISRQTKGAFDMTVAPLVNLWGFGFSKKSEITQQRIDSARALIGYDKIRFENGRIVKEHPQTMLDASAIAKGFACDVVAESLRQHGVQNYMVEIGGEIAACGHNAQGNAWRIGISKPVDDRLAESNDVQDVVGLACGGMATSGNYRNFYVENGRKFAHTIDPATGYPVQHTLLSATIIADDCMTADAYATACMVMGLDSCLQFCERYGIAGYFIFADIGKIQTCRTDNFPLKD